MNALLSCRRSAMVPNLRRDFRCLDSVGTGFLSSGVNAFYLAPRLFSVAWCTYACDATPVARHELRKDPSDSGCSSSR